MPSIYYEKDDGEVYHIEEVSQRLLVYVYLHGEAKVEDVVQPIGADNKHAVQARIKSQLGGHAAQLVSLTKSNQQTLGNHPNNVLLSIELTDIGEEFVEKHRAELSMPVEIAKLAKRVARLQIESGTVDDLRSRIDDLEARIHELEES